LTLGYAIFNPQREPWRSKLIGSQNYQLSGSPCATFTPRLELIW
jgi:hypothetical protein